MARIIAPNREYAGVSAGVSFQGGEAHTDDLHLIEWFRAHGYAVLDEDESVEPTAAQAEREMSKLEDKSGQPKKRGKKKEA